MNLFEIKQKVSTIRGWFSGEEMDAVYGVVKLLKPGSLFVELGTYCGRSTLFFALANQDIDIITIDENDKFWGDEDIPVGKLDEGVADLPNVEQFLGNFSIFVDDFEDQTIDFLFVDGLHTAEGVRKDLDEWVKKIAPGGYILFHDYSDAWADYKAEIDKWLAGEGFELFIKAPLSNNAPLCLVQRKNGNSS